MPHIRGHSPRDRDPNLSPPLRGRDDPPPLHPSFIPHFQYQSRTRRRSASTTSPPLRPGHERTGFMSDTAFEEYDEDETVLPKSLARSQEQMSPVAVVREYEIPRVTAQRRNSVCVRSNNVLAVRSVGCARAMGASEACVLPSVYRKATRCGSSTLLRHCARALSHRH